MRYKIVLALLLVSMPLIFGAVRIPPNPCPEIFQYYKDANGRIYGEAVIPYDNSTYLEFSVNASIVGRYKKMDLKLEMVTGLNELNDFTPSVVYNIFFPFPNIVPKITQLKYNGRILCSGPAEPLVPGTPGITNVWHIIYYQFERRRIGTYEPEVKPDQVDIDLPIKNPGSFPQRPQTPTKPHTPTKSQTPTKPQIPPTAATPSSPNITPPRIPATTETIDTGSRNPLDPFDIESLFTPPTATFTSPSVTTNQGFKCGVSNPRNEITPLIWNSQEAGVGEYPWLVALMVKKMQGEGFDYKCSANLISDNHVITAARCVQYYKVQIVETEDILLVMGTNTLINWQNNGAISRKVNKVESHPAFKENSTSAHGDIAILTMERAVQFSKVLAPVCLWKGNTDIYPFTNKMGVVAGYGQDEEAHREGKLHSVRVKRANMPIVSQNECFTSPLGFQDLISEKTFCTKSGETPTGPCIGDSGAGFFIRLNGAYYLRGIASAISVKNDTCDLSHQYSVFCDAAKYVDWVKAEMD